MGMFDYVTVPVEAQACPACGAKVDGFQSKDGDCRMAEPISWTECDRFYTSCRKCAAWIEYRRTPRPPPTSLAEFQCNVTTKAQMDAERKATAAMFNHDESKSNIITANRPDEATAPAAFAAALEGMRNMKDVPSDFWKSPFDPDKYEITMERNQTPPASDKE